MKRATSNHQSWIMLVSLAILALVLAVAIRAVSSGGPAGMYGTQFGQGYPAPLLTATTGLEGYPPPLSTVTSSPLTDGGAFQTEVAATSDAFETAAFRTPEPTEAYPLKGPRCFVDQLHQFSLKLPAGWYADPPPSALAVGGASIIYNFDPTQLVSEAEELPAGYQKVQISSAPLPADKTFEQWLADRIAFITSDFAPTPNQTVTDPKPFAFGKYEGRTFVVTTVGPPIREIALPVGDGTVLLINLMPAESSAQAQAISLLESSLALSSTSCQ